MIINKKEFKILKSNKINDLQKRKIIRKIEKRIYTIKCILGLIILEATFMVSIIYALNGYSF